MQSTILIVDDDKNLRVAASKVLAAAGHRVAVAASATEALDVLKQEEVVLVLADLRMPDIDGITLLQQVKDIYPAAEVILITGYGCVEKAVEAMRIGAYDFIQKPLDANTLLKVVAKALEKQHLAAENIQLRRQLQSQHGVDALIGNCKPILEVKKLIRQIANTEVCVLIQGESGTGKEIVADALHQLSARCDKPFVKLSCASIPDTLLESELFGHDRGAFTGAIAAKPGKFEVANGGTLLLDEIAEMSPTLQAKLLRVLQNGSFHRLGSVQERHANVRLISATHTDIPRAIAENKFRQDLYYRINTVHLMLPPLRKRDADISLLAGHFLARYAVQMQKCVRAIATDALDQLRTHTWPGNVRELEHVIERAVALATGDTIYEFTFSPYDSNSAITLNTSSAVVSIPIGTTVNEATKLLVRETIKQCDGNKSKAARILGIPSRTMYRHFSDPSQ